MVLWACLGLSPSNLPTHIPYLQVLAANEVGRTLLGRTEDTARFAIHMERDIREALFFAFAEAGLPLLELRPRTASLEEVFLELEGEAE